MTHSFAMRSDHDWAWRVVDQVARQRAQSDRSQMSVTVTLDDQQFSVLALLQQPVLDDSPDGAGVEFHVRMTRRHVGYRPGQEGVGPAGRLSKLFLIRVNPAAVRGRKRQIPDVDGGKRALPYGCLQHANLQRPAPRMGPDPDHDAAASSRCLVDHA